MTLFDSPAIRPLGWTLVHTVWQVAALSALLGLVLGAMRRLRPQARYGVALCALGLCLVAPFMTFAYLSVQGVSSTRPAMSQAVIRTASSMTPGTVSERIEACFPLVVSLWLIGLAFMCLRLAGGLVFLQRLRRNAEAMGQEWQERLNVIAARMGIKRHVPLVISSRVDAPAVVGVAKAVILFPLGVLCRLSPNQVEALLIHELAHVRRYDYLVNLLQSFLEAAMFYHPGVWWISSVLRQEREHCCDDIAVEFLGDRFGYARALVHLEELRVLTPQLALNANGGSLMHRISRIVMPSPRPERPSRALVPAAAAIALVLPLAAIAWSKVPARIPPDQNPPISTVLSDEVNRMLSDPNAQITVDGTPRNVKDLTSEQKERIRRQVKRAGEAADNAVRLARQASREAGIAQQKLLGQDMGVEGAQKHLDSRVMKKVKEAVIEAQQRAEDLQRRAQDIQKRFSQEEMQKMEQDADAASKAAGVMQKEGAAADAERLEDAIRSQVDLADREAFSFVKALNEANRGHRGFPKFASDPRTLKSEIEEGLLPSLMGQLDAARVQDSVILKQKVIDDAVRRGLLSMDSARQQGGYHEANRKMVEMLKAMRDQGVANAKRLQLEEEALNAEIKAGRFNGDHPTFHVSLRRQEDGSYVITLTPTTRTPGEVQTRGSGQSPEPPTPPVPSAPTFEAPSVPTPPVSPAPGWDAP
jgi:beta-lactamase regulating signal transducer with metallopeptidase domain